MNDTYTHLVIIVREGVPEVTGFGSLADAQVFFAVWSAQWSESFLCAVVNGPGKPLCEIVDPNAMRRALDIGPLPPVQARGCGTCEWRGRCTLSDNECNAPDWLQWKPRSHKERT